MNVEVSLDKQESIRAILVDDEIKACINLENILSNYIADNRIKVVATAYNTHDAERLIAIHKPHVLFLDIEMPRENAFQFLTRISRVDFEVIFVTAYDQYAIKALKLNALDYILKPISISELQTAVGKLIARIEDNKILSQYEDYNKLPGDIKNSNANNYIKLRGKDSIEIVLFEDILFLEAQGSYSKFHFKSEGNIKELTMSYAISDYEELLPKDIFFRVHRSFLVNHQLLDCVKVHDNSLMISLGQYQIPVSRRRMNDFLDFYSKKKA